MCRSFVLGISTFLEIYRVLLCITLLGFRRLRLAVWGPECSVDDKLITMLLTTKKVVIIAGMYLFVHTILGSSLLDVTDQHYDL